MSLAPEVLAEQIMGYVVWASELIPTLKSFANKSYSVAIIPQWPHFYTGLLQAAGYLLLDSQKKKILVISQLHDSKSIVVDTTIYGPIFWKTRETSMKVLSKIKTSIGALYSSKEDKQLIEVLHAQTPFLRVITDIKQIIHVGVGNKISPNQNKKLYTWIQKNIQEYNIVLLTNIEISLSSKSPKHDEQKQIEKLIQTWSTSLLGLFHTILDKQKKRPEIVAYVNPWDFGKTASLTTRYICAMG